MKRMKLTSKDILAFILATAISCLVLLFSGCTDPDRSTEILLRQGFTEIQFTGYDWFACSEDDTYSTGFTAVGPTGINVEGTVCCGLLFKSCTVRW